VVVENTYICKQLESRVFHGIGADYASKFLVNHCLCYSIVEVHIAPMAVSFSALSPAQQQTVLDGPALPPPEGMQSNFDNPPSFNTGGYIVVSFCLAISTAFVFIRIYSRAFLTKQFRIEECKYLTSPGPLFNYG
jgi:hypothetical protein